jgi:ABC-2 type transport system permease protein
MTRTAAKYAAFARIAMRDARHEFGELYGRAAFFVVILGVFSALWKAVAEARMPVSGDPATLVWYLASTEWIVLSTPFMFHDIQEAIRRGDVIYQIGRPVSYVGATLAQGLGVLLVRLPVLGVVACVSALTITGSSPSAGAIVAVAAFGLIASGVLMTLHVSIGLLAFWLDDVSPVYWVWQKLLFILGGMMLPLALYPDLIQRAAAFTPFPALLAGPASFVLHEGTVSPVALAGKLVVWLTISLIVTGWLFRRAASGLRVHGG